MNFNIDIIIYICSSIVTIASAFGICLNWLKKYTKNITKDMIESLMEKHNDHVECNIKNVESQLSKHVNKQQIIESHIIDAIRALLRDRINSAYIEYRYKDSIDLHSLYVLEDIHKAYKQFKGNSFADSQMEYIRKLPTYIESENHSREDKLHD